MTRPASLLAIVGLLAACGAHSSSPGTQPQCTGSSTASLDAADFDYALTTQARHDSGMDAFFGGGDSDILARGDQLLAGAALDATAQLSITPEPIEEPGPGCGNALRSGIDAGAARDIYKNLGLNLAIAVLLNEIPEIPFGGVPIVVAGYREDTAGDPSIKADFQVSVGANTVAGSLHSSLSIDAKGTLTMVSSTIGTFQETSTVHIDFDVCPDASGKAKGQISVTRKGTTTPAGGGAALTYDLSVHNDCAFLVNDSAEISGIQITGGAAYSSTGSRTSQIAAQATMSGEVTGLGTPSVTVITNDNSSPEAEKLVGGELVYPAGLVAEATAAPAKKKWQDGTCVEVKTDRDSGAVMPGEMVHVTATVDQKFDGTDMQVPVVGTLDGSGELTPFDPVTAPAGFDYTAGQGGEMGTLTFTSTSKRGIGKKSIILSAGGCGTGGGCWKGTLKIDATGSSDVPLDSMTSMSSSTGNDHIEATYSATISVESDSMNTLHAVSGTVTLDWSHTMEKHTSGKNGDCSFTSEDAVDGTATGDVNLMPGDGTGSISANDGSFQLYYDPPRVALEGSEHSYGSGTASGGPECAAPPTYDRNQALSSMEGIYLSGMGSYADGAHPTIAGSGSAPATLVGLNVTAHFSWDLSLQ